MDSIQDTATEQVVILWKIKSTKEGRGDLFGTGDGDNRVAATTTSGKSIISHHQNDRHKTNELPQFEAVVVFKLERKWDSAVRSDQRIGL